MNHNYNSKLFTENLDEFLKSEWKWICSDSKTKEIFVSINNNGISWIKESVPINVNKIIKRFDNINQESLIHEAKNTKDFNLFLQLYKQILPKIEYRNTCVEGFWCYSSAYSNWKEYLTNNTKYADELEGYFEFIEKYAVDVLEKNEESIYYYNYNKCDFEILKNLFKNKTVIDLWFWLKSSCIEKLANDWFAKQYIWVDISSISSKRKDYKEWKIPVHKFQNDMFHFLEIARESIKNEPKIFVWNWLKIIEKYYYDYSKELNKILKVWDSILFSVEENMVIPIPNISAYNKIKLFDDFHGIFIVNIISYKELFNRILDWSIDIKYLHYDFLCKQVYDSENRYYINNPNYKSVEEVILEIPEKIRLLEKIEEIAYIKQNWWFDKFCTIKWININDIMKNNDYLKEILKLEKN